MDLRRAATNLERLADAVDRRVDREIESAIASIEASTRALEPMEDVVGHLLPGNTGRLLTESLNLLRRTVGAHGGITGVQADTWRLHQTSALRGGASDARAAAEAIFQRQVEAGRQHSRQCR